MGKTKQCKQNVPKNRTLPFLKTEKNRKKHFRKMINNFYSECGSEFKTLTSFNKISDAEYEKITIKLERWILNQLSNYHERDREIIANSFMVLMYKVLEQHDVNPLLCRCWVNILKSHISPELHQGIIRDIEEYDR